MYVPCKGILVNALRVNKIYANIGNQLPVYLKLRSRYYSESRSRSRSLLGCDCGTTGSRPCLPLYQRKKLKVRDILSAIGHYTFTRSTNTFGKQILTTMATSQSPTCLGSPQQSFNYFLVLDFEATCDNRKQPNPQEIIEFPVLKVNASTLNVDSVFHQYVLPQYHPQLSPFCTELTGIIQEMVNDQPHLPEVLQNFHKWMLAEKLFDPENKSIIVTCGDWDLKTMLPKQCAHLDLAPGDCFRKWINIKKAFAEMTGIFPKGMMSMLNELNIKHVGRHHSGIDDCHNIANILISMIRRGFIFKQTGTLR